ncbi:hypothetical protein ACFLYR_01220 [Chloroflexota bacterium]
MAVDLEAKNKRGMAIKENTKLYQYWGMQVLPIVDSCRFLYGTFAKTSFL